MPLSQYIERPMCASRSRQAQGLLISNLWKPKTETSIMSKFFTYIYMDRCVIFWLLAPSLHWYKWYNWEKKLRIWCSVNFVYLNTEQFLFWTAYLGRGELPSYSSTLCLFSLVERCSFLARCRLAASATVEVCLLNLLK